MTWQNNCWPNDPRGAIPRPASPSKSEAPINARREFTHPGTNLSRARSLHRRAKNVTQIPPTFRIFCGQKIASPFVFIRVNSWLKNSPQIPTHLSCVSWFKKPPHPHPDPSAAKNTIHTPYSFPFVVEKTHAPWKPTATIGHTASEHQSRANNPRKQPDIGIPGASTFPAFPVSLQVASRGNSVLKIQRISFQTKLSDPQPDWFAPCRRRQPYHVVFRQPGTLAGSRPAENRISHFSSRKRRPQPQESSRPTRSAEHQ